MRHAQSNHVKPHFGQSFATLEDDIVQDGIPLDLAGPGSLRGGGPQGEREQGE